MSKRPYISRDTKIACVLLELWHARGHGIPFRDAQKMTVAEILARVQWDHGVWHSIGGSIHPTNLTPRLLADHKRKTDKVDIPAIAKGKRVARKQAQHLTRMTEKLMAVDVRGGMDGGEPRKPYKRAWPKRTFAQQRGRGR